MHRTWYKQEGSGVQQPLPTPSPRRRAASPSTDAARTSLAGLPLSAASSPTSPSTPAAFSPTGPVSVPSSPLCLACTGSRTGAPRAPTVAVPRTRSPPRPPPVPRALLLAAPVARLRPLHRGAARRPASSTRSAAACRPWPPRARARAALLRSLLRRSSPCRSSRAAPQRPAAPPPPHR